ncbi:MAG: 2-hydroxyacyl-CoA dehydratase [Deltaproteobacteria bacterium]|nr:2-hydroxyacyl-CoA dehydratase [Deltaproteobacteria bacterium]
MTGPARPPVLDELRAVVRDPATIPRAWKAAGGKVAGVRCLFAPEEILWAAGMLPYPLPGSPEPVRLADAWLQPCTCEYVRNLLDHALDGRLAFLDLLALSNTCDITRRLLDVWPQCMPGTPVHLVNNPQKLLEDGNRQFFLEELRRFQARAEAVSGKPVTPEGLREATRLYDETRALLTELYGLRREDPPRLTGPEAFVAAFAASILPKDRANTLLRRLLDELRSSEPPDRFGPRILVTGSALDDPALLELIEEVGGLVVADDLCTTSRWFAHPVGTDGEPLDALWRMLNKRTLCACTFPTEARFDRILAMVDEFHADAVVQFNLKYCHPFLHESQPLRKRLEARNVPLTILEVGHDRSGFGQLRTRIQAFLEMVEQP